MGAPKGTIVYEVNIAVDAAVQDDYRRWLRGHIDEILSLPGFVGARMFEVLDPPVAGRVSLCVQYRLTDQDALDDYLRDHAPRLRGDAMARFGGRFEAQRRVLRPRRA